MQRSFLLHIYVVFFLPRVDTRKRSFFFLWRVVLQAVSPCAECKFLGRLSAALLIPPYFEAVCVQKTCAHFLLGGLTPEPL